MTNQVELIGGIDFRRMVEGAYHTFIREHESINQLNVFPVPDGDTGTNMLLTMQAAVLALQSAPDVGIGPLSKRVADSAIMGARGNSGVILSQIFRGIARGLAGKQEATSTELGKAFQYGVLYAYRAVARPVEGTILTVAKGIAKGAHKAVRSNLPFIDILEEAIEAGKEELLRTPELLPALKSAGVVDAGGQGLIAFLSGCAEGLTGEYISPEANFESTIIPVYEKGEENYSISHPYCTEFIIMPCQVSVDHARAKLMTMGESVVLAPSQELLKVHIHTAHPGLVLEQAITWGTLHSIKIDNMADQHKNHVVQRKANKLAVISVAPGKGLGSLMKEAGAASIIDGGQTMNPPVEQFIDAVHRGNAEQYIILPNNKNILLSAAQAQKLLGDRVEIVPTDNIPQGLAACMAFDDSLDIQENIKKMTQRVSEVKAGSVTQAVRDSYLEGQLVPAGAFIGIVDGAVTAFSATLEDTLEQVVRQLLEDQSSVVTLYYGREMVKEEVEQLAGQLAKKLQQVEVQIYEGGQANYQFFLSVE